LGSNRTDQHGGSCEDVKLLKFHGIYSLELFELKYFEFYYAMKPVKVTFWFQKKPQRLIFQVFTEGVCSEFKR